MSAEKVREMVETLRAFVNETDEEKIPSYDQVEAAVATLIEHLERLERDLRLAWEVRDAYQFEKEQAEHERDEEIGYRDEYQRLWHRDAGRAEAAEARVRELEEREKSQTGLPYLAVPEDHLIRANLRIAELEAALEAVLTEGGNCTEDEPQDSSCPRCRARKLLGG